IKIEESQFDEINDLVYSYNEMATQLNELYSSLELKVQERTIALEAANYKLKEAQAMMVHSEKMRSLGELVAGIAHEINNPVNFIHGNIMILQNYADDLIGLIDLYSEFDEKLPEDFRAKVESLKKDIDIDFLRGDIKDLIRSCIEGTQRTKNIVLDLKNFSRMEEMVLTQFDIPKEIDTTLNILNNKYKNRITVIKNYSPSVPKIEAYGGQLNQVFMNILDNAQDAIADTGTLIINVDKIDDKVKIEFIDTGSGIAPENLKKVFDPFFTTKAVGKGTGLGMSISYRVIHDHQGTINVESEVGKGTKFTIVLPINHVQQTEDDLVKDLQDGVNS
ncbi:ATP-binding protein, partial [bacterium]|nr:ATP-binding protein [bacterium]